MEKISISNIIRIDNFNSKKAKLIYKDNQGCVKELELKLAEKCWLRKYPHDSLILKLNYMSNGIHYVADRSTDSTQCMLTFFLPEGESLQFYSDDTDKIKFTQIVNLLHSTNWGTFDIT